MRQPLLAAAAILALAACSQQATKTETRTETSGPAPAAAPEAGEPVASTTPDPKQPAGLYSLDPSHSTVVFRLSHLGFSGYTAGFSKIAGDLQIDPARPEAAALSVAIDTKSLTLPAPPAGFHATLTGKDWLDAGKCPQITFKSTGITFKSTGITRTGPDTADVAGDLTLHCVTKPIVIRAKFNGGYPPNAYDGARLGFSGKTSFRRSDFGLGSGIPAPGTNMGVGDRLDVTIETEFGMGAPQPAPAQPAP